MPDRNTKHVNNLLIDSKKKRKISEHIELTHKNDNQKPICNSRSIKKQLSTEHLKSSKK